MRISFCKEVKRVLISKMLYLLYKQKRERRFHNLTFESIGMVEVNSLNK